VAARNRAWVACLKGESTNQLSYSGGERTKFSICRLSSIETISVGQMQALPTHRAKTPFKNLSETGRDRKCFAFALGQLIVRPTTAASECRLRPAVAFTPLKGVLLVLFYTFTLLHFYTFTFLHLYTFTPLHFYTFTLLHFYIFTLLHFYAFTLLHLYTFTPVYFYAFYIFPGLGQTPIPRPLAQDPRPCARFWARVRAKGPTLLHFYTFTVLHFYTFTLFHVYPKPTQAHPTHPCERYATRRYTCTCLHTCTYTSTW